MSTFPDINGAQAKEKMRQLIAYRVFECGFVPMKNNDANAEGIFSMNVSSMRRAAKIGHL